MNTDTQHPTRNGEFASARILIVDDEGAICHTISKALQRIGGFISTATSGEEALRLVAEQAFDVVLTDIRMPDISGVELLTRIKESAPDSVVIMMTGYASLDTAIDAMRLGASDYLVKPSDSQDIRRSVQRGLEHAYELKHRRALLNAIQSSARELASDDPVRSARLAASPAPPPASTSGPISPTTVVQIGKLSIHPGRYQISVEGQVTPIPMTPTEFDLLLYLAAHRGRVVPCQELVREVRGYAANEAEAREVIRPHISNLRRKLALTGQNREMIINVRGVGYRLTDKAD
ncbi:MAG: response regulator transcription factor [Aggregatilineales bacterium]